MKKNRFSFGPQGWAILTLVGGAALASPFLRAPKTGQSLPAGSQTPGTVYDGGSLHYPNVASVASQVRVVSGPLPDTSFAGSGEVVMPDWAGRQSKLDEIIAQGRVAAAPQIAGEPVRSQDSNPAMRPWTTQPEAASNRALQQPGGVGTQARQSADGGVASFGLSNPALPTSPWERSPAEPPHAQPPSRTDAAYAGQWSSPAELRRLAAIAERDASPENANRTAHTGNLIGASLSNTKPQEADRAFAPQVPRTPQFVYQPGLKP